MKKLNLDSIEDVTSRDNFRIINDEITQNQPILQGNWARFELTFDKAVTAYKYKHNLGFIPTDILVTYADNSGYTILYSQFDKDFIYLTTTGSNILKGFVGRYGEK